MSRFQKNTEAFLKLQYGKTVSQASVKELYHSVTGAAMCQIRKNWERPPKGKRICYFSAEFLTGRLISNNLCNLKLTQELAQMLRENNLEIAAFEEIEDAALGNGGLGRLAVCLLDSAATHGLAMNGYGIRYRYGLFRQFFKDGFQQEAPDLWLKWGDPWSVRREEEKVLVQFPDQQVWAVPYDYPVIGYGGKTINTLRLWQAEPASPFDLNAFNRQKYSEAFRETNLAEAITAVLYPNDDTEKGKRLRLKQEYFFVSASLQDLLRSYKTRHKDDFSKFPEEYAVQLNDTHPAVAVPELLRLLLEEGLPVSKAFQLVKNTFAYTNHTVMAEALETWDTRLFRSLLPQVYRAVMLIQKILCRELKQRGISGTAQEAYLPVHGGLVHMARLAVYGSHAVNGVAEIHTELLKTTVLKDWYALSPEKFQNKTNGITQRKWLLQCNPALAGFLTERIGDGWLTDLTQLKRMEAYREDRETLLEFQRIKRQNKKILADYIWKTEGIAVNPDFLFDIQAKRLHEYKRQLLNGFSILDLYYSLKEGALRDFTPTLFLFGAKAAPGYFRAKAVIKYLQEIARLINGDPEVRDQMQMVFVTNYGVSYAEKLMPAAEISQQISLAGTEASGTGNMKFMLNGAVTMGTMDGANIEIVRQAGKENNYIFGLDIRELEEIRDTYDPNLLYRSDARLRRVVDSLTDGTFSDGGTGMFQELHDALLKGASWHRPDHYFVLKDFRSYQEARLKANQDYQNSLAFVQKCFLNMANAGFFSSDRTVLQYYRDIWR